MWSKMQSSVHREQKPVRMEKFQKSVLFYTSSKAEEERGMKALARLAFLLHSLLPTAMTKGFQEIHRSPFAF